VSKCKEAILEFCGYVESMRADDDTEIEVEFLQEVQSLMVSAAALGDDAHYVREPLPEGERLEMLVKGALVDLLPNPQAAALFLVATACSVAERREREAPGPKNPRAVEVVRLSLRGAEPKSEEATSSN